MTRDRAFICVAQRVWLGAIVWLAACGGGGGGSDGTRLEISLGYTDTALDTAEVQVGDRSESADIASKLVLLLPDEVAGTELEVAVWGRKDGRRAAYGASVVTPRLDDAVTLTLALDVCDQRCSGTVLSTCTAAPVSCAIGCSELGDAHCIGIVPSNQVDPALTDGLRGSTTISANTTFDVETGAITGGLSRSSGPGMQNGVGYFQVAGMAGSPPLAVFVFHELTIAPAATVRFTGNRAVVLLVGDEARIDGVIDIAGGHDDRAAPGPGGGRGAGAGMVAQGCGAGGNGASGNTASPNDDSGGGGGGAASAGGTGGDVFVSGVTPNTVGGVAGRACQSLVLEPLVGGSGGGAGSPGSTGAPARGGGGGGAIQISALGRIEVIGTIHAGGAGGDGGPAAAMNAGAGGGGGSGGGILLEAPVVVIARGAVLAANGGGGGGAGAITTGGTAGGPGQDAHASATFATGGICGLADGPVGGAGGALGMPAVDGENADVNGIPSSANAAGGGGAAGTIVVRGRSMTLSGTISPAATQRDVTPRE